MRIWKRLLILGIAAAVCREAVTTSEPSINHALVPGVNVPPVANAGGPYVGDGLIRFDGRGSLDPDGTGPPTYAWDFGDGQKGTGAPPTHAYLNDGTFVVTLTVTDSGGAQSLPGVSAASISGTGGQAVVLAGAANIARCGSPGGVATANLLDGIPGTIMPLGDNAMPNGRPVDYQKCYAPTWGRQYDRARAVLGNHDYDSSSTAAGAFGYFGDKAGPTGLGYYSFDTGAWHVIVLNDNGAFVPYAAGSTQEQWLRADLAAHPSQCTIALWHVPLFLSSNTAGYTVNSTRKILWDDLAAAGVDIVLNGHQHDYERMAPMNPDGTRNDATGIRQFNVGTGGDATVMPTVAIHPNSEVLATDYGVLKLTLRPARYDWEFVPVAGATFTDAGSGTCH